MDHFIQAVAAIIAISNPLGAVPVFLGLTDGWSPSRQRRAALRTAFYVGLILIVAALAGSGLLNLLGISTAAFQSGGGLVVLLMGLEMMTGRPTRVQHDSGDGEDDNDPILVPLAMPMIAGPGAITTVITLTARSPGMSSQLVVLGAVAVEAALLFLALFFASWLHEQVSHRGHRVFLRFMGLILVTMGMQLMLSGLKRFFFS